MKKTFYVVNSKLEKARRMGINVSEVLRKALEEEVRKKEVMILKKELKEVQILDKIDIERVVRNIREDRER
ncbi:MAG: type II toxin-antitoxin system CcdA family antitoxin [Archaeoglobaceae archaeon]